MSRLTIILTIALYPFIAFSEPHPTSDPNPYINLYLQRVIIAEATIKISEEKLKYEQYVLDMDYRVNERSEGTISYQDILNQEALVQIAKANLEQAKAILGKDDALWRLAK